MINYYEAYKKGDCSLLEAYRQCLLEYYNIAVPFPIGELESEMKCWEEQLGNLRQDIISEYVHLNGYEFDETGCVINPKKSETKEMSNIIILEELLDRARTAITNVMEECELPRGKNVTFTDEEIILRALEAYCDNLEG